MNDSATDSQSGFAQAPKRWRFGPAVLDERTLELIVGGKVAPLERKSLDVLLLLLRRAGDAVSKEDLLAAVWPGRIVSDSVLPKCVTYLRAALGDEKQEIIKTVHGTGYRLIAPVTAESAVAVPPVAAISPAVTALPGSTAYSARSTRRLTAIVFTDMAGYSALVHRDEKLARELLDEHRRLVRQWLPRFSGHEVETTGDAFLIHFASALEAVRWAITVQQQHAQRNTATTPERQVVIRIGIHLADVEHSGKALFGDGVNIAARLEPLSPNGGIALSAFVHGQIHNHIKTDFRPLGPQRLKNISTEIDIFVLDPQQLAAVSKADLAWSSPVRSPKGWIWPAVGIVSMIAVIILFALSRPMSVGVNDKSVAVLPFSNFSSDPKDQFLTDGLHDSVLTHLAFISDLRVISRTSVMSYAGGQTPLRDIARSLGVAHIVEGSVQRSGERLRVIVQLIDADTDEHLWANTYDRDLKDLFSVQSEIAQTIATMVHAQITAPEKSRMERRPTQNFEAYTLYLQALDIDRKDAFEAAPWRQGIEKLEQAVVLDSQFALAYALLSKFHLQGWFRGYDASDDRRQQSLRALETAERLDPERVETLLARVVYVSEIEEDLPSAQRVLERALTLAPGNADAHGLFGVALVRQGRWPEALKSLKTAFTLDPRNTDAIFRYGELLAELGRYEEADAILQNLEAAGMMPQLARWTRSDLLYPYRQDLDELEARINEFPASFNPGCRVSLLRWEMHRARRQFDKAARDFDTCPLPGWQVYEAEIIPKQWFTAVAQDLAGNEDEARKNYQVSREYLDSHLGRFPNHHVPRLYLGFALAALGERQKALGQVRTSLDAMPISRDSMEGGEVLSFATEFYAFFGEKALALDSLSRCLNTPYCTKAALVQINPLFDSVRGDPDFNAIISRVTLGTDSGPSER